MFEKLRSCINPLQGHRTQHLNKELSARIQSASAAFGRLHERLWNKHNIKLVTKCNVYRAIILSGLLYSSETYTLYRRHIQRLSQIHIGHLRAILGFRWSNRVTNKEVRQITWTGHVVRMNEDRLPMASYGRQSEMLEHNT